MHWCLCCAGLCGVLFTCEEVTFASAVEADNAIVHGTERPTHRLLSVRLEAMDSDIFDVHLDALFASPSQSQHWNGRKTTRHWKRSAPRQMSRRRAQHARCTRHTLAQRRLQSLAALRPAWRLSANWSPRKFAKLRNGHTRMKTPCAHLRQWCADARTFLVARLRARFGTGSGLLVYLLPHSCPSSPAFETGKPHEKLLGIPDVEPLH